MPVAIASATNIATPGMTFGKMALKGILIMLLFMWFIIKVCFKFIFGIIKLMFNLLTKGVIGAAKGAPAAFMKVGSILFFIGKAIWDFMSK